MAKISDLDLKYLFGTETSLNIYNIGKTIQILRVHEMLSLIAENRIHQINT